MRRLSNAMAKLLIPKGKQQMVNVRMPQTFPHRLNVAHGGAFPVYLRTLISLQSIWLNLLPRRVGVECRTEPGDAGQGARRIASVLKLEYPGPYLRISYEKKEG